MDLKSEVAVVSVFGRGHWLAASLARHKVPVALLDVSSQIGDWKPEDIEGPFGYFHLQSSEKERLEIEAPTVEMKNGLTIWLSDGPLELRGPTRDHRLEQCQIPTAVRDHIQNEKEPTSLRGLDFQQTWLAHLAHYFASPVDTLTSEAVREGLKRNLFSPFHIRQVEGLDSERSLQWCENQGVRVLRDVKVLDLSFEEKKLANLEIRTQKTGIFKADHFVWCLSSEECALLGPQIRSALFPKGAIEPEWAWLRYRIQLRAESSLSKLTRAQLPRHCLVIGDLMLPWTHENMLILQRTLNEEIFDVWMKIPNKQRFHSQYLSEQSQKMKFLLESKIPGIRVWVQDLPLEAQATFEEVGPARHPLYSRSLRAARRSFREGNIYWDSPEHWSALSWEGRFQQEAKIDSDLKAIWDRKEEARLKQEAKDAAKRKKQNKDSGKDSGAEL